MDSSGVTDSRSPKSCLTLKDSHRGDGELMGGSFDVALSGSSKLVPGLNSRWTSLKQVSSNCLPRSPHKLGTNSRVEGGHRGVLR